METNCKNCKYWKVVDFIGGCPTVAKLIMGKCMFNPPSVVVDGTGIRTVWPIVPDDNFCKNFDSSAT